MKKYLSPVIILANGEINMTVSQLGKLGYDVNPAAWNEWYANWEEVILGKWSNFDPLTQGPWNDTGFDINDDSTWDYLTYGD